MLRYVLGSYLYVCASGERSVLEMNGGGGGGDHWYMLIKPQERIRWPRDSGKSEKKRG